MALRITWLDKILYKLSSLPAEQKNTFEDMNEIKEVVNAHADDIEALQQGGGTNDPNAIHDNVAGEIDAITEKETPVDDDWLLIEDSEDSNNKKKVKAGNLPNSGGGGSDVFTDDVEMVLQSSDSFGKYENGDTAPWNGLTSVEAIIDACTDFLTPTFTSFTFNQSSPVEVGTTISGLKTFTWGTNNSGNVEPNTIEIEDVTNSTILGTGLANDGSEELNIGSIQYNSEDSNVWSIQLEDTQGGNSSRNHSISWEYLEFYGATNSIPTDSASVRALPSNRFTGEGDTFTLNTGATEVNFALALPPSKTINQIIDLDALNADITASYINTGIVSVLDAGGNSVNYTVYVMTIASPYSSSHRHQITLS